MLVGKDNILSVTKGYSVRDMLAEGSHHRMSCCLVILWGIWLRSEGASCIEMS